MTTQLTGDSLRSVPEPIVQALTALVRRGRRVILLKGLAGTLAVALGSLMLVMAADRVMTTYDAWPRWLMTAGFWLLTALAAAGLIVRPLARSFTLSGIARVIEQRHPELQERISSAVELLTSEDGPELRGSDVMIAALAAEAVQDASRVQARREVSLAPAWPFLVTAAVSLTLLAALAVLWPGKTMRSVARAFAPWANISKFTERQIAVTPGDTLIQQDAPLRVTARFADQQVTAARLRLLDAAGQEEIVYPMTLIDRDSHDRPTFAFTCPPAAADYQYRVHAAGDDPSRYYSVSVAPRPRVAEILQQIHLPDYTDPGEPIVLESAGSEIAALVGSKVQLTCLLDRRVDSAVLQINEQTEILPAEPIEPDGQGRFRCVYQLEMPATRNGSWTLVMTDPHGFVSTMDPAGTILALPDRRPQIRILQPTQDPIRLKPGAELPILYRAEDDIRLAEARLVVQIEGQKATSIDLPLELREGQVEHNLFIRSTKLQLDQLDTRRRRKLTWFIEVADALPKALGGPQRAASEKRTVEIDAKAPDLIDQVVMAEELHIRQRLEEILERIAEARKDTAPLKRNLVRIAESGSEAKNRESVDLPVSAETRIERIAAHLIKAKALTDELAEQVGPGTFAGFAEPLQTVSREYLGPAENDLTQIRLTREAQTWAKLAETGDYRSYYAEKLIRQLLEQLTTAGKLARRAMKLQETADQQADLVDSAAREQLRAAARSDAEAAQAAAEAFKQQQQELNEKIAELIHEDPLARQKLAEQDAARARDLAGEAGELAEQQAQAAEQTEQAAQIEQLNHQQQKLARQQQELADEAAESEKTREQAEAMKQAAEKIEQGQLDPAAQLQDQAAKALKQTDSKLARDQKRLAQQTRQLAEKKAQLAQQQDRQMQRLTAQQEQIAEQAARLARKVSQQQPQSNAEATAAATEAREAAQQTKQQQPGEAAKRAEQAAEQLTRAADKLSGRPADNKAAQPENQPAQQDGRQGEDASSSDQQSTGQQQGAQDGDQQVAVAAEDVQPASAGSQSPAQKQARQQLAQAAKDLADQQQSVAKQLAELARQDARALAAERQKQLQQQTGSLSRAVEEVENQLEGLDLPEQAGQQVAEAAGKLAQASSAQAAAQESLDKGQFDQAGQKQQAAAQALEQAAQSLAQAGQSLQQAAAQAAAEAADQPALPGQDDASAGQLAEAMQQAGQAATTGQLDPAAAAASNLGQLAEAAAAAAAQAGATQLPQPPSGMAAQPGQAAPGQQTGQQPGQGQQPGTQPGNQPGQSPESQTGAGMMTVDETAVRLRRLGISPDDWARLPGRLQGEVLQAGSQDSPAEYRGLIRQYFRILSQRSSRPGAAEESP